MKFLKQVKEFESYMFVKNFTERTIGSYLNQIILFLKFLDIHYPRINELSKITKDVIFDYIDYLLTLKGKKKDRPISNSTIGKKIISLKSFFGFLFKHDYILSNPTSFVELPKEDKTLPRVILSEKEVMEIIDETVDQLVTTFNYISNNPVAAKLSKSSSEYVYTGFYHLIHKIYSIVTPYEYDFIL
jgi:site-specific recombinase XerD